MPFLNKDTMVPVLDSNAAAHKCGLVQLTDAELTRQLHVCTGAWSRWEGTVNHHTVFSPELGRPEGRSSRLLLGGTHLGIPKKAPEAVPD